MKHSFYVAALAAVLALCVAARAQDTSSRTVIKSVTVGTEGGKVLTCNDINTRKTFPAVKPFGWTSASELTEKPSFHIRHEPVLPKSSNPEVSYGKVPSRNEFGIDIGYYPSPDGSLLAVYRVDETAVSSFPLLDIKSRSGSLVSVKYPMNGTPSEHVALCVCDTLGNVLNTLEINEFDDELYIAGVSWTPGSDGLSQHVRRLSMLNENEVTAVANALANAWGETDYSLYDFNVNVWIQLGANMLTTIINSEYVQVYYYPNGDEMTEDDYADFTDFMNVLTIE